MGLAFLKWIIAVFFALALTTAMRQFLGRRGRQDAILLAGSVVSAAFVLSGIVGLVLSERNAFVSLCFGLVGTVWMTRRWHSQDVSGDSIPNA